MSCENQKFFIKGRFLGKHNPVKTVLNNYNSQVLMRPHFRYCIICRQRSQVVRSAGIVINMVEVQNLLALFCCVPGKETLRHFPQQGGLGKQF